MAGIRPFVERDIPRVVELSEELFPGSKALSVEEQRRRFKEVCFNNPWYHPKVSSIVYEDDDGKVVGFVAVVPRRMSLNGRDVSMAVSQHLMVDPKGRSTFAAVEMMRALFAGPQEFTVADMSTDLSKRLWDRLGGKTSLLYSFHWRKPLRPVSFALSLLKEHKAARVAAAAATPLLPLGDAIANRLIKPPNGRAISTMTEPLTAAMLVPLIKEFYGNFSLVPKYDERSLDWLLNYETQEQRFGSLQSAVVKNADGKTLGWFIYHLKKGGSSQVLQIGARENTIETVLDALFRHAVRGGALELTGRMEPVFMREFNQRRCIIVPARSWVLVSSKNPEVLSAFAEGKAFLSRLEGDPWFF